MAIQIPVTSPLTETQSELTSKIGSMKSLLSLPVDKLLNIPKQNQISTYDYLMKLLRILGIDPELIFNIFLDQVFDETGTFLEEKVFNALADSIGEKGIQLPSTNNPGATDAEKEAYKTSNRVYIAGLLPPTFLQAFKQQMAKNLVIMIFGPKDGPASDALNPSASERNRLVDDAVCGVNLFSLSSDPIVREENVEFNRVALKKQLEKGEVIFEISCQEVKITLPEEPGYFFEGGGQFTDSSVVPPTPTQSLELVVQHVKNEGQNINNEENSNSIGSSFYEILITKLMNYISSLVFPFLGPIFTLINGTPAGAGLDATNVVYTNCDIMNGSTDVGADEQQSFLRSLANALLKELLRMLLVFAIKEFKKLVSNYFARTSLEKAKRRAEKIKQKFAIFNVLGDAAETASKALKYAAAVAALASILGNALDS